MPTEIPIPGALAARLGLTRNTLAAVEETVPGQQGARLNPARFFDLQVVRGLIASHPGLLLDHYVPFDRRQNGWAFDSEIKGPWLRAFARQASESYRSAQAPWRNWSRQHRLLYPDGGADVRRKMLRPSWRWVIGLGNQTILETGLTLHHTYGIPYIPGSALKGLTQALVMLEQEPARLTTELIPDRQAMHDRIFGTQQQAGEVVFVGGIPVADGATPPRLSVDIMTPHFPAYYQGSRTDPLEVEDPTPIPFLVSAGGAYDITLAARNSSGVGILDLALKLCLAALDELGVGGKTGKGYGYFGGG